MWTKVKLRQTTQVQLQTNISYSSCFNVSNKSHNRDTFPSVLLTVWHSWFCVWMPESDPVATLTEMHFMIFYLNLTHVNSEMFHSTQLSPHHCEMKLLWKWIIHISAYSSFYRQMNICTCTRKMQAQCHHVMISDNLLTSVMYCVSFQHHTSSVFLIHCEFPSVFIGLLTLERSNKDSKVSRDDDITLKWVRQWHLSGYKVLASG